MKDIGIVQSISQVPLGGYISGIAKAVSESGAERQLQVGDQVNQHEKIIPSLGTYVEIEYSNISGLLTCIYM